MYGDKKYNNLNYYLREKFGEKVYKLSIDAGFTCPNRDGKISTKGCIFCNERGAGDFTGNRGDSIYKQAKDQIEMIKKKSDAKKYIIYFQNFTNTYDTPEKLEELYNTALRIENVVGISIATRADCLSDEVIDILRKLNDKTELWIEIGLQTINDEIAAKINRGYNLDIFEKRYNELKKYNIKVVIHLIANLLEETKYDFLKSIEYISFKKVFGLKIHMLYITKDSPLFKYYTEKPFYIMNMNEYSDLIVESLKILDKEIVIHRLTGDPNQENLFLPEWTLNKRGVLNLINKKINQYL